MRQDRSSGLQQVVESIVSELGDDLPIHRASVPLIEADSTMRIAALWTDAPTVLGQSVSFQTTATAIDEIIQLPGRVLVRPIDPDRDLLESLLWEDGLRVFAVVPIYREGRLAGLFALSSRDPHAFAGRDLSFLNEYAERISAALAAPV